jgi:hypothetical protein
VKLKIQRKRVEKNEVKEDLIDRVVKIREEEEELEGTIEDLSEEKKKNEEKYVG